VHSGWCCW